MEISNKIDVTDSSYFRMDEQSKRLLKQYFKIENFYRYALKEMQIKIENINDYCEKSFAHNPIHNIESRIKNPVNIIEKMHRRGYEMTLNNLETKLYDIAGLRVVCNYIDDIYRVNDLLKMQSGVKFREEKDYIKNPKPSGYRSLHTILDVEITIGYSKKIVPVEIQFRTIAMDMWASLEHELRYKANNVYTDDDKQRLRKHSDDLYDIDLSMQKLYIRKSARETEDD
jgi:putative GTP pyrophosphokinase